MGNADGYKNERLQGGHRKAQKRRECYRASPPADEFGASRPPNWNGGG